MRKLELGTLPDRIAVSTIGDKTRVTFRAQTGEEIAADLSVAQVAGLREGLNAAELQQVTECLKES